MTSRGLAVPTSVEQTPDQRIVEAAAVLRAGEAVTGWAALRWQGAAWFDGTSDGAAPRDVPLVATRHLVAQTGFGVSQEFLAPTDVLVVDGLPITSSVRSTVFEMRYAAGPGQAVEGLDMACFSDLVSLSEVRAYLDAAGPGTGIQQARDGLVAGEENSWSPRETAMRGVWVKVAGLARPLCNAPVFDLEGRHVGTPDLIDPALGLVGQYNGALHLAGSQVAKDLKTDAAFRDLGLEPVTMVAADWSNLDDFAVRLLAARKRLLERPTARRWTLEPPAWWTPTTAVALRRALEGWQREKYLGYRLTG